MTDHQISQQPRGKAKFHICVKQLWDVVQLVVHPFQLLS